MSEKSTVNVTFKKVNVKSWVKLEIMLAKLRKGKSVWFREVLEREVGK